MSTPPNPPSTPQVPPIRRVLGSVSTFTNRLTRNLNNTRRAPNESDTRHLATSTHETERTTYLNEFGERDLAAEELWQDCMRAQDRMWERERRNGQEVTPEMIQRDRESFRQTFDTAIREGNRMRREDEERHRRGDEMRRQIRERRREEGSERDGESLERMERARRDRERRRRVRRVAREGDELPGYSAFGENGVGEESGLGNAVQQLSEEQLLDELVRRGWNRMLPSNGVDGAWIHAVFRYNTPYETSPPPPYQRRPRTRSETRDTNPLTPEEMNHFMGSPLNSHTPQAPAQPRPPLQNPTRIPNNSTTRAPPARPPRPLTPNLELEPLNHQAFHSVHNRSAITKFIEEALVNELANRINDARMAGWRMDDEQELGMRVELRMLVREVGMRVQRERERSRGDGGGRGRGRRTESTGVRLHRSDRGYGVDAGTGAGAEEEL